MRVRGVINAQLDEDPVYYQGQGRNNNEDGKGPTTASISASASEGEGEGKGLNNANGGEGMSQEGMLQGGGGGGEIGLDLNDFPGGGEGETEETALLDSMKENYFSDSSKQKYRISKQVFNLSNTIVGAGLMALPKVVEKLGIIPGVVSLVLVLICAIKTLGYILKESQRVESTDFAEVVRQRLGSRMSLLLDFSIIINNIGLLIIYLRIISDVLIGNDQYLGIITEFMHKGLLTRPEFTVGLITFLVLFPLCSLERMDSLAAASTSGLMLALSFSVITIAMAIIEISKNGLQGVAWQPNPKYFSGNLLEGLIVVIGVFPVIFTSLVCHYNLLHVKEDLPLRHRNKIGKVVNLAGGGCITLYILVASFGYILFKDDVQGDVLLNFNCKSLEPLVGSHGCIVVAVLVRSMYAITLTMTFPLIHFALRQTIMTLCFRPENRTTLVRWTSTFVNLLVALIVALKVPNIWTPLQLTGAVAAGLIGFMIPSLLHLHAEPQEKTVGSCAIAVLLFSLGFLVGVVTIWQLCTGQLG